MEKPNLEGTTSFTCIQKSNTLFKCIAEGKINEEPIILDNVVDLNFVDNTKETLNTTAEFYKNSEHLINDRLVSEFPSGFNALATMFGVTQYRKDEKLDCEITDSPMADNGINILCTLNKK